MKKFRYILTYGFAMLSLLATAQEATGLHALTQKMDEHNVFNKVEIAANVGTTGLGLEVASPVTRWAKLRVGGDFMPRFMIPMNFGLESYVDGKINDKFGKIQDMMYKMSGMEIDRQVEMESKPNMNTFHLLVDVFPFQNNRHWHFTAGFYLGSKTVGKSLNKMQEMPSLLALNMYDRMYNHITSDEFMDKVYDDPNYLANLTGISALEGSYLDPAAAQELQDKFLSMGRLGVHVGDRLHTEINEETGEEETVAVPYMMMPDKDGTVSARAVVNKFRPYLGFGYAGALSKDSKWQIGVDAGVQFWGGVPKVITHDGTVLNDLDRLRGKVGDYMDLMKCVPVYPTINCRVSYTF